MKISGRAGHNEKCRGAKAKLDEVTEDRKIFPYSKSYLEQKHTFIDCTPYHNPATQSEDLNYGIKKSNENNADLFYSVHLNKAYDNYDGALGCEVWVYDKNSTKAIEAGERILENLEALGFKNRGIKYMKEQKKELGELMYTKCNALIVECFFLEASKDIEVYNKVGPEAIGLAIANGIDPSITRKVTETPKKDKKYWVVTNYIPRGEYGFASKKFIADYFYDIPGEVYINSNAAGPWAETCYLPYEKCLELKTRLGDLFNSIKEH